MLRLLVITLSLWLFFSASTVLAQSSSVSRGGPLSRLNNIFTNTPSYSPVTTESTLLLYVGQIINVVFGLFGTIFIVLTVLAGFKYMTARGDGKKTGEALDSIRHAILGLIITSGSYAIWQFVFIRLLN
jgi:hypothetical protein